MKLVLAIAVVMLALRLKAAEPIVVAVICAEARGEGRDGMAAVWEVIWTLSKETGRKPAAVVTRPGRFSCLNGVTPASLIRKMQRTPQWNWANSVAMAAPRTSLTHGANHFTRSDELPYWAAGRRPVAVVGQHSFYRL
jgi:spore germination cell wall hydrolase CwlJ-like protein